MKEEQKTIEKVFTVSEYINIINTELNNYKAKIIGEIGKVDTGPTGHIYFSLRDEKNGNIISCIIWQYLYKIFGIELKEGIKIIASGIPELYGPTGRFSFKCESIEVVGIGALKKEYDRLKKQLTEEGIFEVARKRAIPKYIRKIGIITSKQGAVIEDFLGNLGRYGLDVKIIDSRVEGQTAVIELLSAINFFKRYNIEALVIIRGGGSFESMAPFNNEFLVREIANFPVPVITGIGHHKDMPLAALASDFNADTASIVATTITQSWREANLLLARYKDNIFIGYEDLLKGINSSIIQSAYVIKSGFNLTVQKIKFCLEQIENIIFANNPEQQLKIGYSIARINGKIIKNARDAEIGNNIDISISDGIISSEIKIIKTN